MFTRGNGRRGRGTPRSRPRTYWARSRRQFGWAFCPELGVPDLGSAGLGLGSYSTLVQRPKKKKAKVEVDKTTLKYKFHQVLKRVTGDVGAREFAISKHLPEAPLILISIKDGETLHFPMSENEVPRVIHAFGRSPYGKGTETILDSTFRNSWQMSPEGFTIMNPAWDIFIKNVLVPLIGREFAITSPFTTSLYKMLLYTKGSFFKPHRDSEKENGMFGTLVVQLPSLYTGGQMVVNHGTQSKTFDLGSDATPGAGFSTLFAAFYCDCLHEILPLTSGVRVCLVYNLTITGKNTKLPAAPVSTTEETQLNALCRTWRELELKEPSKLVYALQHKYTEKNISFENLKSTDKAIALLLKHVALQNDMTVGLAIFEKKSSGTENGDDEFDSGDSECYCETEYFLNNLQIIVNSPFGETAAVGDSWLKEMDGLTVYPEFEVIPEDCWDSIQPFNSEREETGNEGVNVNLFYRSAALVFWPKEDILDVVIQSEGGGVKLRLAEKIYMKEVNGAKSNAEPSSSTDHHVKATEAKLTNWTETLVKGLKMFGGGGHGTWMEKNEAEGVALLNAVSEYGGLTQLADFLKIHSGLSAKKIPVLVALCEKHGWNTLSPQIENMFSKMVETEGRWAQGLVILRLLIGAPPIFADEEKRNTCLKIAQILLDSFAKPKPKPDFFYYFQPTPVKTPEQKKAEAEAAQKFLCGFYNTVGEIGDFDLMPVVESSPLELICSVILKLGVGKKVQNDPGLLSLCECLLKRMEEVAKKPVVIPTWKRTDFKRCVNSACVDCVTLETFMQSDLVTQGFKIGKRRRQHLHQLMNTMGNVTHITEGPDSRPTMVVTKTRKDEAELVEQQVVARDMPKLQEIIAKAKDKARPAASAAASAPTV